MMMYKKQYMLAFLVMALLGCGKEAESTQTNETSSPEGKSTKQTATTGDEMSCETLANGIRQACIDRYAEGLLFECGRFSLKLSSTLSATQVVNTGSADKAEVAAKMCGKLGEQFQAELAAAGSTEVTPACSELGKYLEEQCFRQIGDPDYNVSMCNQMLSSSRPMTEDSCAITLKLSGAMLGQGNN
jgi:hypothetical protein